MRDPYQILGVSHDASDDEIKTAYRSLAKQYHPDLNHDMPQAEAKMKEINEAYDLLIKKKNQGGSYQSSRGSYGGYGNPTGSGSFGGFGGFDFSGFEEFFRQSQSAYDTGGSYSSSDYRETNPQLKQVESAVLAGRYQEALYSLAATANRSAAWYYWSARAHLGLSNRVAALKDARIAVQMAPGEMAFQQLLNQLQYAGQAYQRQSVRRGFGNALCANPCITLALANMACNLCCGYGRGLYFCC